MVSLPTVAARAVVIVASLSYVQCAWIAIQALADLGILPSDMETENTDRASGLRLEDDDKIKVLGYFRESGVRTGGHLSQRTPRSVTSCGRS